MSFTSEFEKLYNEKQKKKTQKAQSMIGLFNAYSQELGAKQPQDSGGIELFQDPESENVAKIILGTAGEAVVDTAQGFMGFAEGIADWIGHNVIYPVARATGQTENDLKWYRKALTESTTQKVLGGVDAALDKHSVLGHTSDAVFQGVGQFIPMVAGGKALQAAGWGATAANLGVKSMMGVSAMGSAQSEAYAGGATDGEALAYGAASAGSELLFESLFGGMGKALNMVGFSKGLSSLDDIAAKGIAKFISSPAGKNVAQMLVKGGFEGLEEVGTGFAQAVAKKLTYMSEEEFGKILKDENLFEQFIVGALVSDIAQAGDVRTANKTGTDLVIGLTQNEQSVVDKEVENRVVQEEKGGKKLSGKEKNAIYEQVVRDMERGYISTETIESVLGKDALTQYDALSKEAEEFKTLYETEGGKLSEKQKDRLAELKEKNKANPYEQLLKSEREKISRDVSALAQKDRLGESYNERTRSGQKFQADVSKYSEAQRKTVQNAIDSGILNNTNRSHEFVDLVAKVSADKGISFDFADNAKLKESGFALDGVLVNGFVNENGVTINIQSAKALNRVVGHEITHVLEGTELYDALQSTVTEYAKTKKDYNRRLKELTELYEGKNANVEQELVADLVGDYLFTDADFIRHLSTEHRNLAQKIYDEIKYLCKVVTAGTKEARQLEKVKKAFADAYRAETKNPTAEGGGKYSLGQYSDVQKENWKNSKKIVVYENDAQLLQFVRESIANSDAANKMYFGTISGDLAKRIKADTGLNFDGKNAVLRAKNVRKILLHDHGNVASEKLRGQIAVTETDFLAIKDIFGDPDTIKPEPQGYKGKPAATFEKVIGGKKYTMFVVDSGGSLDIFVQTMYIHKQKGSIANVANAKALTSTPKATVGTAPTTNVQQNNPVVKQQNSLSKKDFSIAPPVGTDVHGRDIAAHPDDWIPIRKDIPQKAAKNAAQPTEGNMRRLTTDDIADYMRVGERKHVRDAKQRIVDSGESPILTKPSEILDFIRNAFHGKIKDVVKGYGRVNDKLAKVVKDATNGKVDIDDYYLELDANRIAHLSDHVGQDKDARNIPLTEEQISHLPEYVDSFDDLINVIQRKDGSVRLMLGKKINGHSIIVETVSKGRSALHPVTAYQIDTNDYMNNYKTRAIDRSSTSRPANADTVDISRPAIAPVNTSISNPQSVVNPEDSTGAAPSGFDPVSHLQYEYGSLPEGEKPVREDSLPKSTTGKDKVSMTARTVKGAEATPDDLVDLLDKTVVEGGLSYIPLSNDATVQKAYDRIKELGWKEALEDWKADVRAGKVSAELSATGALLLNNAANAGDRAVWLDVLHEYQRMGTSAAQAVQALRILKTLAPEDKLYMIHKSVDQMNKDSGYDVEVDEELLNEWDEAETDAERDEVLDAIMQNVADQIPATFMEKFTALRYVNMLGNLRTQVRNVAGNLSMKGVRTIHNTIATGLEAIVNTVSRGKTGRTRAVAVSKEQKSAAKHDFEKLKSVILDGGKYSDSVDASTEFAKGVQEKRRMFKFKPLEGYRKATNWAMEQGDLIFARDAYARALAGYLRANGITETDYSKIDTKVLEDARLFAIKEAQEATFRDTNALSGWISKVGRRRDTHKVGKLISEGVMPFRKTPANVLIRAEEYSPLGVINSALMSVGKALGSTSLVEKQGVLGNIARAGQQLDGTKVINSWAKSLTGAGLFALGMLLQSLGCLVGGADDDESKDRFDSLNGWQNYAIVLPDGTNLTIDFLTPTAMPMLMGAELSQLMADEGFELKYLEPALTSITEPMVQMSMLQGINDTLDNVKYSDNSLMQMAINSGLSYLTQGLTNTLLGQVERAFEDSRTTTYVDKDSAIPDWLQRTIGKASAKMPGLDYNQIPYINAWGEEEEYGNVAENLAYNMISPSYVDKGEEDEVSKELLRLNEVQSKNVFPNTPAKSLSFTDVNKKVHTDYQLSAEEYVSLAKTQGKMQRELVEEAISNKLYGKLTDTEKAKVIENIYKYAKEYARGEVIEGYADDYGCFSTKWMSKIRGNVAYEIISHVYDQRI